MPVFIFLHFLFAVFAASNTSVTTPEGPAIQVTVTGIRSDKGEILAALFAGEKGFPGDAAKAFRAAKGLPQKGKAHLSFEQVPPGTYAIALFHDEDGDGKLNTNFIGLPKEGYGVSNNVKNLFSGPSFQQAAFRHQTSTQLTIVMRY